MPRYIDLRQGDIKKILFRLSLPLMGTAFVQMAYSLVDLIWLGKLSTNAVAAVGTSGFYIWIADAIMLISGTGIAVGLAQAYGEDNRETSEKVVRAGFQINIIICILLILIYASMHKRIIGYYHLEPVVEKMTIEYFLIVTIGFIFKFSTSAKSSTFYAKGDSITPFRVSAISLLINIILDPILIFGLGPFPRLEVNGAAIATVVAQFINAFLYFIIGKKYSEIYERVKFFKEFNREAVLNILKLGVPVSAQSIIHAFVGVKLNRYIAGFGAGAIAVYAIGSQIESISWMTAEGFSKAFSAFFGQNYGYRDFKRLKEGKKEGMKIIVSLGVFASILLFVFSRGLFMIFISEDMHVVEMGSWYLKIIAFSELFMAIEIGIAGMLNGLGLTRYPAINAAVLNIARIPFAYFMIPIFGLNGIWGAMSISSVLKGLSMLAIFNILNKKTNGFRN